MSKHIMIGSRKIGPGLPAYIIAEMSANHQKDFDQAVRIIRAAKDADADAVKLQTYTPDTITINCDNEYFRVGKGTIWEGRNLYDLYRDAFTPWEWQPKLKEIANDLGLDLFSTPFDESAVDFLESMGVPAYKIASFEIVDIPLLEKVAKSGKPIILSTGMASFSEIEEAVRSLREAGASQIALLKCTSAYPARHEDIHLRTIPHLAESFQLPVGISDHTLGIAVPVASIALGACIVEKHLTVSRSIPGPDSAFSLEPNEFKLMTEAIRNAEKALGKVNYDISPSEEASRAFRRSLFVIKDIKAGDSITLENVKSIRPAHGLPTKHLHDVLGRKAKVDIKKGTPLNWALLT